MGYVVTIADTSGSPRTDHPWTVAHLQEALDENGQPAATWATIDTITLSPVDTDPADPQPRTLTTENATVADGWYRVVFADATGDSDAPTDPVRNTQPAYLPSVRDVASHLRIRTKEVGGTRELGTFNASTRPTGDQVAHIAARAANRIRLKVGAVPAQLNDEARELAALLAALRVERSYYGEQIGAPNSPYQAIKTDYDEGLKALDEAVGELGGGDLVGPADDKVLPAWSFDPAPTEPGVGGSEWPLPLADCW